MKRSDRQRQRIGLIWLDWVLILLLLGALGGGAWVLHLRSRAAEPTQKIEYVIKISSISDAYATENRGWNTLIPKGAQVTTANAVAMLGRVESVVLRPHVVVGVRDGKIVFSEGRGIGDLYVTVRGDAVVRTGDGLRISDIRIAAGGVGDFRIGTFYAPNARIISVRRVEHE